MAILMLAEHRLSILGFYKSICINGQTVVMVKLYEVSYGISYTVRFYIKIFCLTPVLFVLRTLCNS